MTISRRSASRRLGLILLGIGLLVSTPAAARAIDSVKTTTEPTAIGGAVEVSQTEITVRQGVLTKTIPVNEVDYITFDTEPLDMKRARASMRKSDFDDVLKAVSKMDPRELRRPEIKADYEFFKAVAATRLAIAGGGPKDKQDAGRQLLAFEKAHAQSYHFFDACEALGDLFVSLNRSDQAAIYFAKLAAAPWPEMQLHGKLLLAQLLAKQKKYKEAILKYDEVLAADGAAGDERVLREKQAATLNRATAVAATGKVDESIKVIQKLIDSAGPDESLFYARAYNALGTCYMLGGRSKEALLAFLHTSLLYSQYDEEDAEALANLARLWTDVNQGNRGTATRNLLKEKYPFSPWAQNL